LNTIYNFQEENRVIDCW